MLAKWIQRPPLPARIDAVLFDLDGTLVDTEDWHLESSLRLLRGQGIAVERSDLLPFLGWAEVPYYQALGQRFGLRGEAAHLARQRAVLFREILHEVSIEALPGVLDTLDALARLHLPVAVASSSTREVIEATLEAGGLRGRIDAIRSGHDDVRQGKPAADVYLAAAAAVGVDAHHAIAVEDTATGLAAARASGAWCVLVPNHRLAEVPTGADWTLPDLRPFAAALNDRETPRRIPRRSDGRSGIPSHESNSDPIT